MKRWSFFLPLILIYLLVGCGQSAEKVATQTATAATAIAAAWTKTPIPTSTHTPTSTPTMTPTSTMTPTITPTPLGGGSGQIACLNCVNGIFPSISLVNPDGAGTTLLTDKYSAGASFYWSRNGARLGYFTITGLEEQTKYLTCVVEANGYNEQCFEIGGGTFSLSPDGSKMAIGEHSPNLYLVDFDSGKSEILMETAAMQWSGWDVDWSPNGTKLVVAGDEIGITVINVMNKEKFPVVEADKPDYYNAPRWSPDGKQIVFSKRNNLFIVNADGSDPLLLVRNAYDPIWSPDGTHIAYITGNSNQQNIIMMNADGTNKVRLTPSQSLYQWSWSPDGKFIVYRVIVAGSVYSTFYTDIYKVEVANQKVSSLTKSHNALRYTISPDGSAIAFTLEPKGAEKCNKSYVMNLDGVILSEWKDLPCNGVVGPWRP